MPQRIDRRSFLEGSVAAAALGAAGLSAGQAAAPAAGAKATTSGLPKGRIGKLQVSRLLLGGNLLTHYTHSRDLRYVYDLTAHYNTPAKILETLALAEQNGIDTLSIHTVPSALKVLREHREKHGGKMQWIICPTAPVVEGLKEYEKQVRELIDMGTEAIYLWGVHGDRLAAGNRVKLIAGAVELAKKYGVPSGVGGHDLKVVKLCEEHKVPNDFYIKTFHHHNYPTGPKGDELKRPYNEFPGYWCQDPKETAEVMARVEKPWIAFKVMAAGAIPPKNAFAYAFNGGADHVLAGMFDFEVVKDARTARWAVQSAKRTRPWRS